MPNPGARAQYKSGEVLNKGGCSDLLYFIGNNPDFIAMYRDRYIPNLFPARRYDHHTHARRYDHHAHARAPVRRRIARRESR